MAVEIFHDQVSTKECAGFGDRTRGHLHAKRQKQLKNAKMPLIIPKSLCGHTTCFKIDTASKCNGFPKVRSSDILKMTPHL